MIYPYGKAPAAIAIAAALALTAIVAFRAIKREGEAANNRPVINLLVLSTFDQRMHLKIVPEFERTHGVRVRIQVVDYQSVNRRFRAALVSGSPVADVVEISKEAMSGLLRGQVQDIPLVDLTDLLKRDGLYDRYLPSRRDMWSTRGHVFALPRDVLPVALMYRKDIVDQMGIDVSKIETWDDFVAMGQKLTRDVDGDGVIDHYALELEVSNYRILTTLLLQAGISNFDAQGRINFYQPKTVDIIYWYVMQYRGPHRIGVSPGQGTREMQALNSGLVVFWFMLDQRTSIFADLVPGLKGKFALMPLPAWERGGPHTVSFAGTGLVITNWAEKTGKKELAWELAKFLYTRRESAEIIFDDHHVVPPIPDLWADPIFDRPDPFFNSQHLGRFYIEQAKGATTDYLNPSWDAANGQVVGVLHNALNYYTKHGEEGLRTYIDRELRLGRDNIARMMQHDKLTPAPAD